MRRAFVLIALAIGLAWFTLSPTPRAFGVTPAPDGGYPNGNTAEGEDALFHLTDGFNNTAVGFQALFRNTTGFDNTAVGFRALASSVTSPGNTAVGNTAVGSGALSANTTGFTNTAIGAGALVSNTAGYQNTATGTEALGFNTTGINNTATGHLALLFNTRGNDNTAAGLNALSSNTTGSRNTATGSLALVVNTEGNANTATGLRSLFGNTIGKNNTATGDHALTSNNTSGSSNVALGNQAGRNLTGSNNILLGHQAGSGLTSGDNNIAIGAQGAALDTNTIRIGSRETHNATFIAGIAGVAVTGTQVVVNSTGQLGVAASSARYKEQIKPMDKASEAILALKPVIFRYKKEVDPKGIPQFGLAAEEVEKINPDLVARDENGQVYTVRYEAVNTMLLNEFLKEHRKTEEQDRKIRAQEATITQLRNEVGTVIARLKVQDTKIQKISDQVEINKPGLQLVAKNH